MSTFELRIDIYAPGGKRGAVEVIDGKRAIPSPVSQDEEATMNSLAYSAEGGSECVNPC